MGARRCTGRRVYGRGRASYRSVKAVSPDEAPPRTAPGETARAAGGNIETVHGEQEVGGARHALPRRGLGHNFTTLSRPKEPDIYGQVGHGRKL